MVSVKGLEAVCAIVHVSFHFCLAEFPGTQGMKFSTGVSETKVVRKKRVEVGEEKS